MRTSCTCCERPPWRPRRACGAAWRAPRLPAADDPADMGPTRLLGWQEACHELKSMSACALHPCGVISATQNAHVLHHCSAQLNNAQAKRTLACNKQKPHRTKQPNTQHKRTNKQTANQTKKGKQKHTDVQQTQRHISTSTKKHRTTHTCPHVHVCVCS